MVRAGLIWGALLAAVLVPVAAAAGSPLLEWRDPVYIAAGFAGILALGLVLVQPLLIGGYLPGLSALRRRLGHQWVGGVLVLAVVVHVGGLWMTSPPDMMDALMFASPTVFSGFGVVAMWAVFAIGVLAALRRRLGIRLRTWRLVHLGLAVVVVVGGVVHAVLIEGAMETVSKGVLCGLVLVAMVGVWGRRWGLWRRVGGMWL